MGFFSRGGDGDAEQAESLARIEDGGIPRPAEERLQALAADGSLFTSGLSVNEFALLDRLGPQAAGSGDGRERRAARLAVSAAARAGNGRSSPARRTCRRPPGGRCRTATRSRRLAQVRNYKWHTEVVCELDVLSDAWNMARRRALDRLREEASQVGADAVVGVHLRPQRPRSRQGADRVRGDRDGDPAPELHRDGTRRSSPTCRSRTTGGCAASARSRSGWWPRPPSCSPPRRGRRACGEREPSRATRSSRSSARGFSRHARRSGRHCRAGLRRPWGGRGRRRVLALGPPREVRAGIVAADQRQRGWHTGRFGVPYRVSGHGEAERSGLGDHHACRGHGHPPRGGPRRPLR